jgi:crossover junction endodeoxyribonuclease RusA
MRIEVAGIPAPQGSKRHAGGGRMVEQSRAVGPWREAVRHETQRVMSNGGRADNWWPTKTWPVTVQLVFRLPRPKSAAKGVKWPAKRPDLDKLTRAVLDGLVAGGAIADDGLVVYLSAKKTFASETRGPGCDIVIEEAWSDS